MECLQGVIAVAIWCLVYDGIMAIISGSFQTLFSAAGQIVGYIMLKMYGHV